MVAKAAEGSAGQRQRVRCNPSPAFSALSMRSAKTLRWPLIRAGPHTGHRAQRQRARPFGLCLGNPPCRMEFSTGEATASRAAPRPRRSITAPDRGQKWLSLAVGMLVGRRASRARAGAAAGELAWRCCNGGGRWCLAARAGAAAGELAWRCCNGGGRCMSYEPRIVWQVTFPALRISKACLWHAARGL